MPAAAPARTFRCRFCDELLTCSLIDLGMSPLCEDFIRGSELSDPETFYPLEVMVCAGCGLAQVDQFTPRGGIFDDDYGYYSSISTTWMRHAKRYVDMVIARFRLDCDSTVVEVASNDGYLLRNFVDLGIPCYGIDPSANVAEAAGKVGVETLVEFFGADLADRLRAERGPADLLIGNNVLAHTPDLKGFLAGVSTLVAPGGQATFEFPHLMRLMDGVQFDTIYHEHFSYFSLYTVSRLFESVGMRVVDVEQLPTHGGSMRIFVEHVARGTAISERVGRLVEEEERFGLRDMATYASFPARVHDVKYGLLELLVELKRAGKRVVGYGAPGKGNTLLNYCGIKPDLLEYTCDRSAHKHGRRCPGSRIPIHPPSKIDEDRPDVILILPWNLTAEITAQLAHTREWGARFAVPLPVARLLD